MSKCQYCLQEHENSPCKRDDLLVALDHYETRRFYNNMKDHWSDADYAFDRKMLDYILDIKELIGDENTDND